jgi:subtilisin family serine protease
MNPNRFPQALRRGTARTTALAAAALLLSACAFVFLATTAAFAQEVEPAAAHRAEVNQLLAEDLAAADGPVSFLVILRDQPDPTALLAAADLQSAAAADRRAALYRVLTAHAAASQAPLRAWLDARGVRYTPHYLANMIEVHGDAALAEELRLRPDVDRLARNPAVRQTHTLSGPLYGPSRAPAATGTPVASGAGAGWPLIGRVTPRSAFIQAPASAPAPTAAAALPYGLTYTKADQVWALGIRGQGVVIGSQDTGVQWDHPALRTAYRGYNTQAQTADHVYNWFDAFGRNQDDTFRGCSPDPQVPCDDDKHGTHTVGTMVGDATPDAGEVLGMAPDARWVGCRNMRGGVGTPASYTACFEWFIAPYPQGGDPFTDGKPALAPDIVNNSWGCPPSEGCDTGTLQQIVDTVRAAGIFNVASAGNEGGTDPFNNPNSCRTIATPIGLYDSVFTVGAHGANGSIALFSSRGPVTADGSNRLKPDLTAPGIGIYSSVPGGYQFLSGTSMASPHVAGAVALLWSAAPELKGEIDRTEEILRKAATPVLDNLCDAFGTPRSPNNIFGFGRLDALAAVNLARQPATLTVALQGGSGQAATGREVQLVDQRTKVVYSGVTDISGEVAWEATDARTGLLAGTYELWIEGCAGLTSAGSVTLAPGQAAEKTVISANAFCLALPQIYNR